MTAAYLLEMCHGLVCLSSKLVLQHLALGSSVMP